MKCKDQLLLEEAYDKVQVARVERYATPEEIKIIKDYIADSHIYLEGIDLSKGWVWDVKKDVKSFASRINNIYISFKDETDDHTSKTFRGYTTFLINPFTLEAYWIGNSALEGRLTEDAIKRFEMTRELPELEGVF